jgi:hypothetical protein
MNSTKNIPFFFGYYEETLQNGETVRNYNLSDSTNKGDMKSELCTIQSIIENNDTDKLSVIRNFYNNPKNKERIITELDKFIEIGSDEDIKCILSIVDKETVFSCITEEQISYIEKIS